MTKEELFEQRFASWVALIVGTGVLLPILLWGWVIGI